MGFFSSGSKNKQSSSSQFDVATLEIGLSYDEVVKKCSGVTFRPNTERLSDDFTYSEEERASLKKSELPFEYFVEPIHGFGLEGSALLGFDNDKKLATVSATFDNQFIKNERVVEQAIAMSVVSHTVDGYSESLGTPEKEIDEEFGSYSWAWSRDGVRTNLSATVNTDSALKTVESLFFWRGVKSEGQ